MMRRKVPRFSMPLRQRLFLLVFVALLPLAAMSAIGAWVFAHQRRSEVEQAATQSMRAARAALDVQLWKMISAAETLAASDLLGDELKLEEFHAAARRVVEARPDWGKVDLLDLQGRKVLDSEQSFGSILAEASDLDSFRRVIATGQPVVGALTPSTVPGDPLMTVRVPVESGGRLTHVLTLSAWPSTLLAVLQQRDAPLGSVVSVLDSLGQRVVASAGAPSLLLSLDDLMRSELQGPRTEGFVRSVVPEPRGQQVYAAFGRSDDTHFAIGLAVPASSLESATDRSYAVLGIGLLLSLLLGGAAAAFVARGIARPIASLRAAAVEIGGGREPVVETGSDIPEIREVAEALNMASEARGRERRAREELLKQEQTARAAAERDNRAKDEFLAMLGHELRTPLAAIANAGHLMDAASESDCQQPREIIRRQTAHLVRLVDDLLDGGRVMTGKIVLNRTSVDLLSVARNALQALQAAGRCDDHVITLDGAPAWVCADPVRLEQIVTNLLGNALKYTPRGGRVQLAIERRGDEVVLSVRDDGSGIEPELLPRVFDLFAQGSQSAHRSRGGLGIGLTLVKRLAELHGGAVQAVSAGPGCGSTFVVRLPAVAAPAQLRPAAPRKAADTPRKRLRVVVVEDNDDARQMLGELIGRLGHDVEVACDGPTGLDAVLGTAPDVAFVDVGLPGFDGLELARRLRSLNRTPPTLVALTGYGARSDQERARAVGFDCHVVKPIDLDTLKALLSAESARSEPPSHEASPGDVAPDQPFQPEGASHPSRASGS